MRCLEKLARSSIRLALFFCVFSLFIASTHAGCGLSEAGTNSTKQLICNLTLCELNTTKYENSFSYVVEAFVLFPAATHVLSFWFLTTAHFLDALTLGSVVVAGYLESRWIISSVYLFGALCATIFFMCRFVRNCMALRYKCTRYTNFIIDTKGKLHRNSSPVLVQEHGRVHTADGLIEVKTVVLDGQLARLSKTIPAERWQTP